MNPFKALLPVTCAMLLGLAVQVRAQTNLTTLHAFTGQAGETDSYPYARLILSGSTFYGTTYGNGNSDGTVFKVNTNGTGFTVLYTFTGGTDGANPEAGLVLSNGTLYGTTSSGGSGYGTVFSVSTSGTGFKTLHTFTGGSDGGIPLAGLVLSSGTLYGTTYAGGAGDGVVFKVSTSGSGFTVLHSFTGGSDGSFPEADLILSNGTLYGTAAEGGNSGYGTVFKVSTSGSGFTLLHTFTGGSDGGIPLASLVLSGSTLYSTTYDGGNSGFGTVFSVSTSGTGFATLWSFTDGNDGAEPSAGLVLSGSTLYGTSSAGGSGQNGTVFSINTNGTGFNVLHLFSGSDGSNPVAALTLSGSTLYGTTPYGGGGAQSVGTLFKVNTNGTGFATVYIFMAIDFTDGVSPQAGLVRSGNMLYGTTAFGGDFDFGSVFEVSLNGDVYKVLHSFTGPDGATPTCRLVLSGDTLYGTTANGSTGNGTVFKIKTDGSGFSTLHVLNGSDGANPSAGLVLSGSTLYGVTENGLASPSYGTIFKVGTDGSGYRVLHNFIGGADGEVPMSELLLSGSTLYGTTLGGGNSDSDGTLFKINTDGSGFTTLYDLNNSAGDGGSPSGNLVLSNGTLYGVAGSGGSGNNGTVFSFNISSRVFTVLYAFMGNSDGHGPESLIISGSTLYGVTRRGGINDNGAVFSLSTSGEGYATLWSFSGDDGELPFGGQLVLLNSVLYGTTGSGGAGSDGTVFSLRIP